MKKKLVVFLLAGAMCLTLASCGGESGTPATNDAAAESVVSESLSISDEEYVSQVEKAIEGDISSKGGESIDAVEMKDGVLTIKMTLGDPAPLTIEDLAVARFSAITDHIFSLDTCPWEKITVDFGDAGHITKLKSESLDNYTFDPAELKLEQ